MCDEAELEVEVDEKRGNWRWPLVAILCWLISIFSLDGGIRSVLLGTGMYFNVVFIDHFISWRKSDYLIIRFISAIVFTLPCVVVTLYLLNQYSPIDLNGTKPILLLSPIVYGVMFYLGVYISEKLKCSNWLSFLVILLCMFWAGIFRMSAFLMYPATYGFMLTSAFGLIAMLTCIVCGGLFVSKKNVILFAGLLLIAFVIGFFCNARYGGGYKRELFMADKHNPEILEDSNYTLAVVLNNYNGRRSLKFIFNNAGLKNNLELKDNFIYDKAANQNVVKLTNDDDKDLTIAPDLVLKVVRESNEIYLDSGKEKDMIFFAKGDSPSYAEKIKRIFYINDGKVYSRNLSGKDEIFHCNIDQPGNNYYSFTFVSPDGKFLLYDGPRLLFRETSLSAVLELSSGKSHLVPEKYWWEISRRSPKAWISKKLLISK